MRWTYMPARICLVVTHRERLVDSLGRIPIIPRIDSDTRPESAIRVRTRELCQISQKSAEAVLTSSPQSSQQINSTHLAENKRSLPLMLALHKLMRPQRHPLSQTSNHKRISSTQQSQIHRERDILRMQQHDWLIRE